MESVEQEPASPYHILKVCEGYDVHYYGIALLEQVFRNYF